jgi:steroid delta-isomerase-like uncharacterized protein
MSLATPQTAEQNKTLIRQILQEFDGAPRVEQMARWLAPDFTTMVNGEPPFTRDMYLAMCADMIRAFTDIRHEIHDVVAEGDRVAVSLTLHLTHSAEYEGIAPTGRAVKVPEMSFMVIRDGLIASERVIVDLAGLHQQLTAAG